MQSIGGTTSMKITKELLEDLYIKQNLSKEAVCKITGIKINKMTRLFKQYGLKKSQESKNQIMAETNKQKYGSISPLGNAEVQDKYKKTCLEKFGETNPLKSKQVQAKKDNTCLERYGVHNYSMTKEYLIKKRKTEYTKYGVEHYSKTSEYAEKVNSTMHKNHSFTKSKDHLECERLLLQKFKDDLLTEYQDNRYKNPTNNRKFPCDFYIKSLDLFIEYQGYYAHGSEPFDPTNEKHLKIAEDLKKKGLSKLSIHYKKPKNLYALEVWTKRDPLKRQIAKDNHLNYLEFFNMKEFLNWYNSL